MQKIQNDIIVGKQDKDSPGRRSCVDVWVIAADGMNDDKGQKKLANGGGSGPA